MKTNLPSKVVVLSAILSATVILLRSSTPSNIPLTQQLRILMEQKSKKYCQNGYSSSKMKANVRSNYIDNYKDLSDNQIAQYLDGKKTMEEVVLVLGLMCVPYIVMLVIIIIGYQCYFWCCVCDSYCPPCSFCRRDYDQKPLTRFELFYYVIALIVLSICLIGVTVAGLVKTSDIKYVFKNMICVFLEVPETIVNGVVMAGNKTFIGIDKLADRF